MDKKKIDEVVSLGQLIIQLANSVLWIIELTNVRIITVVYIDTFSPSKKHFLQMYFYIKKLIIIIILTEKNMMFDHNL